MERFDVTIAGELNLDLILYGLPEQLLPERELLVSEMMVTLGSSSAIVAHNLAALGCKVGFSSCIGSDSFGGIALDRLTAAGVDVSTVRQLGPQTRTGLTVILPREEWRNILTYAGTISALNGEHLDRAYLRSSRHFHLSSYYLQSGLQSHVPELLRELKSAGLSVSVDTNDSPDDDWDKGLMNVLPYVEDSRERQPGIGAESANRTGSPGGGEAGRKRRNGLPGQRAVAQPGGEAGQGD